MHASLEHAVHRTVTTFDQMSLLWGPDRRLNVSVHGLPHHEMHFIAEEEIAYPHPGTTPVSWVLSARASTRLGWSVSFFGAADPDCPRCQELAHADEAAQMAGVTG